MRSRWEIPNDHHSQFPAIPRRAMRAETYRGVSTLKVVAAIEVPASHQGSARPPMKKSTTPRLARRDSHSPTMSVQTR